MVKYPILIISGIIAVAQAAPLLFASLWRTATSTYTRVAGGGRSRMPTFSSRDDFARGRGGYDNADVEDEGELLGDDSDDDV